MKHILLVFLIPLIFSCSSQSQANQNHVPKSTNELLDFAQANCFFWYFKKKGYDLEDIRSISGGIVETGSYSADRYQQVSLMVKSYSPSIETKQNIDIDLLKCFHLSKDSDFIKLVSQTK